MTDDDRERFDILFAGECLEGQDAAAVRDAMAKLFRADEATLERLFSGQRQRIKGDVDRATALKYQNAMRSAGAKAIVQRTQGSPASPGGSTPRAAEAQPATTAGAALSLGPAGADLLRPEERPRPEATAPDVDHLSMADAGSMLSDAVTTRAPDVAVPDYEVAAAGTDLGDKDTAPTPPAPDTSSIELSAGELDLSDCQPEPAAPLDLDLSHLDVAASGTDLLAEDERPRREGHVPDTSHLHIEGGDTT